MKIIFAVCVAGIVGCGGKSKDWSKEPLKATTCTFKGHTFEISIPDGLDAKQFEGECDWKKDTSAESFVDIHLMLGGSKNAAEAKRFIAGKPTIVKAEDTPEGGYVLIYHYDDKRLVDAEVIKPAGDAKVQCRAGAANVANPDATLEWLKSICSSLKIKS
jgi:hypothetical protein